MVVGHNSDCRRMACGIECDASWRPDAVLVGLDAPLSGTWCVCDLLDRQLSMRSHRQRGVVRNACISCGTSEHLGPTPMATRMGTALSHLRWSCNAGV